MEVSTQIRCVVVGDSGVGKSSILLRYANDEFDECSEPTLGAAFVSKVQQINGRSVKFQIWDTAGQEKYRAIAPIYYRQSEIAICVYDISNRKSFQALQQWVSYLQEYSPENMMFVVVGNKCDKVEQEEVSYKEGKDFADSLNAMFKLTSAKEGKGINDMFIDIRIAYLRQMALKSKGPEVPSQSQKNKLKAKSSRRKCC